MERDNRLLFLISGIILLGLVCTFFFVNTRGRSESSKAPDVISSSEGEIPNEFSEIPVLTNKNTKISKPEGRYTLDIDYPELAISSHPNYAKEANAVIDSFVKDVSSKFITSVEGANTSSMPESLSSDLTMRWKALLVSPSIISLRFDSSAYVSGTAHPDNRTRILNYDFEKHLLLSPSNFFSSSTIALPFLSSTTRSILKAQLGDESTDIFNAQTVPGTEPKYENFQEIGITKKGLLVIFNPYQVAAYARGTIEVPIDLPLLTDPESGTSLLIPEISNAITLSTTNIQEAKEETQ